LTADPPTLLSSRATLAELSSHFEGRSHAVLYRHFVVGGSALLLAFGGAGGAIAFATGRDDQTLTGSAADQARVAAFAPPAAAVPASSSLRAQTPTSTAPPTASR
jgi:hypothetical protein